MIILALDPSSTRTGYCLGTDTGQLIDAGLLSVDAALSPVEKALSMARDAWSLVVEHRPDQIIIEAPAPQAPVIHGKDGVRIMQRGQANFGMCVGAIIQRLAIGRLAGPDGKAMPRIPADYPRADEWTRGSSKKHRQLITMQEYPTQYDPKRDPGMDTSDAVQLWRSWLVRRRIEAAKQGAR